MLETHCGLQEGSCLSSELWAQNSWEDGAYIQPYLSGRPGCQSKDSGEFHSLELSRNSVFPPLLEI